MQQRRYDEILRYLNENGYRSVAQLCDVLYVSEATLRRDLAKMEQQGLLCRVRGGAVPASGWQMQHVDIRKADLSEEKRQLARRAAAMVESGMTIYMDGGSITQFMPEFLTQRNITVVSASLELCLYTTRHNIHTYCLGGYVDPMDLACRGSFAERTAEDMRFDMMFFTCSGLSPDGKLTAISESGASLLKRLLSFSSKRVFLTLSGRVGTQTPLIVTPLAEIDAVICDAPLPENLAAMVGANRPASAVPKKNDKGVLRR